MRFAIVAGEASGDILGAALVRALRQRYPQAVFYGVAGPRMREAGCEVIESIEALSVMGLAEVLRHLPRLVKLRSRLAQRFIADKPDVFIGIDAPDFNLGLERKLKQHGIRTVHFVSPTVWAWRQSRIHDIAQSVDLMLCLFPFEQAIYREHRVRVAYVGHPLADELDDRVSTADARRVLGLAAQGPVVAILPGSRHGELKYLAQPFVEAAARLAQQLPGLSFLTPVAKPGLRYEFEQAIAKHAPGLAWTLLDGQSREAMQAADAVLLASGTATLECLLLGRPMVVAYRASALTGFLMLKAGLLKIDRVSLPNLLSAAPSASAPRPAQVPGTSSSQEPRPGDNKSSSMTPAAQPRVPELLQGDASPERLAQELYCLLRHPVLRASQLEQFDAVRRELKRNAADRAADAIEELLAR